MIDIHSHILPAFDDGVQTMDEAIDLLQMEKRGGTRGIFATPHIIENRDYERIHEVEERICALREALARAGVDMEVAPGGEVYPTSAMLKGLDRGDPITLGGHKRHMLIDLPMMTIPHDLDDLLYEVQVRGVTPILAHPERVGTFQQDPDRLLVRLEKGALCQVNAGSLAGKYGPRAVEVAHYFLDRKWASFLASDAHRAGRKPILGECVRFIRAEFGSEYIDEITKSNPEAVWKGMDLPSRELSSPKVPTLFQRVFKKNRR